MLIIPAVLTKETPVRHWNEPAGHLAIDSEVLLHKWAEVIRTCLMIYDVARFCVCVLACVCMWSHFVHGFGFKRCVWGYLLSIDCITLILYHQRRRTTAILSSLVSSKCPFATRKAPARGVKANQEFLLMPPSPRLFSISSPVLSTVTYHPATSAARHLLSETVWGPFNPPSK